MKLLDLFCGAGGCSVGYANAGFDVVGVDIEHQPNYPFEFHQADALTYPLDGFDVIHASPPCQEYSLLAKLNRAQGREVRHSDLVSAVRDRLAGKLYVIENVVVAPLDRTLMLCGTMFGLNVVRHRLFEVSQLFLHNLRCKHTGSEVGVYGEMDGRRLWTRADGSEIRAAKTLEDARAAMGIDWMGWKELTQSIPPAYTEWIGRRIMEAHNQ